MNLDVIRGILAESVVRLIQSQSQDGTASAIPHEIDKECLALGLIGLENLADLLTGSL